MTTKNQAPFTTCEKCGRDLDEASIIWLTLNNLTGTYTDKEVPAEFNQGAFAFGADCAQKMIAEHNQKIKPEYVLTQLLETSDGKTAEIIAVFYGEKGYTKTTWGRQSKEWVKEQNERIGITNPAIEMAYSTCSLFGNWSNYDNVINSITEAMNKKSLATK